MGKVIKVIDLLIMMANEEELPKKIKHLKEEYQVVNRMGFVSCESKSGLCLDLVQCLNDKVEILDEEDEIDIQELSEMQNPETWQAEDTDITSIVININRLTKAVKQLDNKINKLESNTGIHIYPPN